jgi:hypothetical protein
VSEIQHGAPARVPLVLRHDGDLGARALEDHVAKRRPDRARRSGERAPKARRRRSVPSSAPRRSPRQLLAGQGARAVGSARTSDRLVVGRRRNSSPPAGRRRSCRRRRVDLAHQRGRGLHERDAALVGRGTETGEIPDTRHRPKASTQSSRRAPPPASSRRMRSRLGDRLGAHRAPSISMVSSLRGSNRACCWSARGVRDAEGARRAAPPQSPARRVVLAGRSLPLADDRGVRASLGLRHAMRTPRPALASRPATARRPRPRSWPPWAGSPGELLVGRAPGGEQPGELLPIVGQRTAGARGAVPRDSPRHVAPDGKVFARARCTATLSTAPRRARQPRRGRHLAARASRTETTRRSSRRRNSCSPSRSKKPRSARRARPRSGRRVDHPRPRRSRGPARPGSCPPP